MTEDLVPILLVGLAARPRWHLLTFGAPAEVPVSPEVPVIFNVILICHRRGNPQILIKRSVLKNMDKKRFFLSLVSKYILHGDSSGNCGRGLCCRPFVCSRPMIVERSGVAHAGR